MPTRRTIDSFSRTETPPIKGSRFTATVAPATTEAEALAVIDAVRAEWPAATHHCWAYRLPDGRTRSSDDGEPGGSAGRPILARLEGDDLRGAVVVVTRWYGGTKLGVGGLIRAYGGAATAALADAHIIEVPETVRVEVVHGYGDTGAVASVLRELGLEASDTAYGGSVTMTVIVPTGLEDTVAHRLTEATAARAQVRTGF